MTQSVYQSELDPDAADAASAGHGPDAVDEWYSAPLRPLGLPEPDEGDPSAWTFVAAPDSRRLWARGRRRAVALVVVLFVLTLAVAVAAAIGTGSVPPVTTHAPATDPGGSGTSGVPAGSGTGSTPIPASSGIYVPPSSVSVPPLQVPPVVSVPSGAGHTTASSGRMA
ncbi:MAG: hypothetical protein ABSG81_05625 [Acidimicrobiales bacterium]|jgi:hypothetical protein